MIEYRTIWLPDERIYLCRWRELAVIRPTPSERRRPGATPAQPAGDRLNPAGSATTKRDPP